MQKQKKYRRLSSAQREEISRGLARGQTFSAIALSIGRETSTVSRKVETGSGKTGYRSFSASVRARVAASSRKLGKSRLVSGTFSSSSEDKLLAS